MEKRRLPVGIQTFGRIREEGYYYVDKTGYARRLAEEGGGRFFLSRPRRFGKSLFVDTLKELYEGSERLFRGLAVHGAWDWSLRRPVVRLSFAGGNFKRPGELAESTTAQIEDIGRRAGVDSGGGSAPVRFRRLIRSLHEHRRARRGAGGRIRQTSGGGGPALRRALEGEDWAGLEALFRRGAETRDVVAFDVEPG